MRSDKHSLKDLSIKYFKTTPFIRKHAFIIGLATCAFGFCSFLVNIFSRSVILFLGLILVLIILAVVYRQRIIEGASPRRLWGWISAVIITIVLARNQIMSVVRNPDQLEGYVQGPLSVMAGVLVLVGLGISAVKLTTVIVNWVKKLFGQGKNVLAVAGFSASIFSIFLWIIFLVLFAIWMTNFSDELLLNRDRSSNQPAESVTRVLAILPSLISGILAVLFMVIGGYNAIKALQQSSKSDGQGRKLAVAGMIISLISSPAILLFLFWALLFFSLFLPASA